MWRLGIQPPRILFSPLRTAKGVGQVSCDAHGLSRESCLYTAWPVQLVLGSYVQGQFLGG